MNATEIRRTPLAASDDTIGALHIRETWAIVDWPHNPTTGENEPYTVVYSADGWRVTEVPIPAAAYGVLEDNPHLIDTLRTLQEP
nr:MAG TPA: hypothetical protein [Caudoviricetes sp.]